ncbi:rhamnan synthesis F family protein [Rhizobium sp. GR12]|uniref:rhamnan synthesis F family protein n=1 Tax=Rhizobium sp. GR12 TaxID=3053925 RepID=UPI002FBDFF27
MNKLTFAISDPGKYYLSLNCQNANMLIFSIESEGEAYNYYVMPRYEKNFYFLRCNTKRLKLTITADSSVEGKLIRRRGIRSFGIRKKQILGSVLTRRKLRKVDLRLPGVSVQEILSFSFFRSVQALDQDVVPALRIREGAAITLLARDLKILQEDMLTSLATQFARKFDNCTDNGFIFLLNGEGLSPQCQAALCVWAKEVMGDPAQECGPAWDLLRSNPSIGAVFGIADSRRVVVSWSNGRRLEKILEALGIDAVEITSAGRLPRCMLIRKSSLVALKALNFSAEDLGNGLVNERLLELVILPLVRRTGALVAEMPAEKSHILQYESLDDAKFVVGRTLSSPAGKDICLFVGLLNKSGAFSLHALRYMRALRSAGLHVFALGVATGDVSGSIDPGVDTCDAFAARENSGYDFALWATALKLYPDLWDANSLLMANDSVFVAEDRLPRIIDELNRSAFDVTGLTGCEMENFHLQSFFIRLNRAAIDSPAVRKFWDQVVSWKDKFRIISAYEVAMTAKYESAGLRCGALFDSDRRLGGRRINPSINLWREILQQGYPFVKVQLLRDNPTNENIAGWRRLLVQNGFDLDAIVLQLSKEAPHAVSLRVE